MRLSIKSKIMINAGFTILVVSLLAIVIFFRVQRLSVLQEKVYVLSDAAFSAQTASQCGPMLYNVISGAMINHDMSPTSKGWLNAKERSSGMVRKALEKSLDDQQQKNAKIALDAISEAAAIFETKLSPVIDSSTGITSDMQDIYMEIADKVDLVTVHMGKNAAALTKASAEATKEFEKVRQAAVREMILLPLAAVVLLLGFSLITARSILRPLGNLLTMLRGIVNGGGLSGRLQITTHDETAEIGSLFNQFVEKLQMMILNVAQVADGVASAAARVSTTAEEMAASSVEAQSEAQAVAAASQELAATADDISANCVSAAERSKVANKAAGEGASTISENCALITAIAGKVEETAKEVEDLRRDSEAIAAIITTIEEIADYTNMLALNAAIEAARAGESGRGFAVVADEVRSLADRTTNATKEVAALVSSVQARVTATVEAMQARAKEVVAVAEGSDTSAKVITLIDGQVQDLAQQINQIATAAEEQTATTADISRNLQHINEVVEQASKGAKETSEASGDLTRLSQKLQGVVRDFEVKHEQISA